MKYTIFASPAKATGMPELRDLYTVGDDEDVAALALYRHLHERTERPLGGSASFQGEAR